MLRGDVVSMSRGQNEEATGKRIGYKTDIYPIIREKCCFDVVQMLF